MYVKYSNDKTVVSFPYDVKDLYHEYPNTYFPPHLTNEILSSYNIARVVMTGPCEYNQQTQLPEMVGCFYNEKKDRWETEWKNRDLTTEEIATVRNRIYSDMEYGLQNRINEFATTRGYTSIDSIGKYQNISDQEINLLPASDQPLVAKFRTECRYLAVAAAHTWAVFYSLMNECKAGEREYPNNLEEIEPLLPKLEWPV